MSPGSQPGRRTASVAGEPPEQPGQRMTEATREGTMKSLPAMLAVVIALGWPRTTPSDECRRTGTGPRSTRTPRLARRLEVRGDDGGDHEGAEDDETARYP